jgi:16S rRNA (guanine527-N7)-methyltransferase
MTKTLLNMIKKGGFIVAYKAKIENIKEEMSGIENLIKEYQVENLLVPGLEDSERNLVVCVK